MSPEQRQPWVGSTRGRATSSTAWQRLRLTILERDGRRCYLCGGGGADAVDHIIAVSQGGTDDPNNLSAVHERVWPHCHRAKSGREGGKARGVKYSAKRPLERHPGLKP